MSTVYFFFLFISGLLSFQYFSLGVLQFYNFFFFILTLNRRRGVRKSADV